MCYDVLCMVLLFAFACFSISCMLLCVCFVVLAACFVYCYVVVLCLCCLISMPPTESNIFIHSFQGHPVLPPLNFQLLQEGLRVRKGLVVLQIMHEAQGCIKGLHFH